MEDKIAGMRFCFTLLLLLLTFQQASAQAIGKEMVDFDFQTLEGKTITLSELRKGSPSGVLMLTIWCTDCASCRSSEKALSKLSREYKGKVRILALASSKSDSLTDVVDYVKKNKLDIEVLMDPRSRFAHHLKVTRTTTTLLLDKDGRARYFGALSQGNKTFAKNSLAEVMQGKIVGRPLGPMFGCPIVLHTGETL